MFNLHESMGPTGIELATPESAVRHASVARHVTDCATRPGIIGIEDLKNVLDIMGVFHVYL